MSNRLTIKGQVTIPKEVRDFLGLTAGNSAIEFSIDPDGSVRITKAQSVAPRAAAPDASVDLSRPAVNHCDRILALLSGCALAA